MPESAADRRPIMMVYCPHGGGAYYQRNKWGLDPGFVADPGRVITDGLARADAVEQAWGSQLTFCGRDSCGVLEGHWVSPHPWDAASPKFRQFITAKRPRIDMVYLGWWLPAHRNTALASTEPQLRGPTLHRERAAVLRGQLAPFREFCGTTMVGADASCDDFAGGADLEPELAAFNLRLFREFVPIVAVGHDPAGPGGVLYDLNTFLLAQGPHLISLRNLRKFDPQKRWDFRPFTVHIQPDELATPGELEAIAARGGIIGVWPQWTGTRMQSTAEMVAMLKLNGGADA